VTCISVSRGTPFKWPRPALLLIAMLGFLLLNSSNATALAADGQRVLSYDVKHSVFGDIGTYTNVIQTAGTATTVHTTAHFRVSALGVGLHNEDADRTERWNGDRLVSFHGITKKNGDTIEIRGEANGNNFVIASPTGTITAPGTIRPANPWSTKCLGSTTMMRVDTGKVEPVRVSGGGETAVAIGGASVPAREYQIEGATRYKVWFDRQDTPVMFIVDDDSGKVTFTLKN
jgi:hypothetical protein